MKIAKGKKRGTSVGGLSKPSLNAKKKNGALIVITVLIVLVAVWINFMGRKAQETVTVAVLNQNVYKNQLIREDMLVPYEMLIGEYEKLIYTGKNGNTVRRVVMWDEVGNAINKFAAYPLQEGKYLEKGDVTGVRVDNSDSVLYTFPGKEIVKLDIGSNDLKTFRNFIQPGDKVNIHAVYKDRIETASGSQDVVKTEEVFRDIMVADLLNTDGDSVLDIYTSYKDLSTATQVQLQKDEAFKASVQPQSLLVALTPEELERYLYFKNKQGVTFNLSLPQRLN